MNVIIKPLKTKLVETYLPMMYDILHENMSKIAPTGNTYEEDKAIWTSYVKPALEQGRRNVILISKENDFVGFFQYFVNDTTFMMDEIQFKPEYQGRGIFTELYRYLVNILPQDIHYIEAYANKKNLKSQAILKHLGLEVIGENKNGNSYHFKGKYKRLFDRYKRTNIAYCGLACCVCSENYKCVGCQNGGCDIHSWCKNYNCCKFKGLNGCWECNGFPCSGGMLDKPRIRAFARFAKEYGTDELTKCLLRNKENGIVYHYDGQLVGEYDKCETEGDIIEMIKTGEKP